MKHAELRLRAIYKPALTTCDFQLFEDRLNASFYVSVMECDRRPLSLRSSHIRPQDRCIMTKSVSLHQSFCGIPRRATRSSRSSLHIARRCLKCAAEFRFLYFWFRARVDAVPADPVYRCARRARSHVTLHHSRMVGHVHAESQSNKIS